MRESKLCSKTAEPNDTGYLDKACSMPRRKKNVMANNTTIQQQVTIIISGGHAKVNKRTPKERNGSDAHLTRLETKGEKKRSV